jgi:hypothetical protein
MSEKRRVVAYPMHSSDRARAEVALGSCLEAGTLLIGEADAAVIDDLRKQGVVLRDLGPATRASTAAVPDLPAGGYVVVKVREPLAEPHRLAIEAAGLELADRLGQRAFVARLKRAGAAGAVAALAFVDGVEAYETKVKSGRRPARTSRVTPPPPKRRQRAKRPCLRPRFEPMMCFCTRRTIGTPWKPLRSRTASQYSAAARARSASKPAQIKPKN